MRWQLRNAHHPLRHHMADARGIFRRIPADGQARHMKAQAMASALQNRHADTDARLLHDTSGNP